MDAQIDQFKAQKDAELKDAQIRKANAESEERELKNDLLESGVIKVLGPEGIPKTETL